MCKDLGGLRFFEKAAKYLVFGITPSVEASFLGWPFWDDHYGNWIRVPVELDQSPIVLF